MRPSEPGVYQIDRAGEYPNIGILHSDGRMSLATGNHISLSNARFNGCTFTRLVPEPVPANSVDMTVDEATAFIEEKWQRGDLSIRTIKAMKIILDAYRALACMGADDQVKGSEDECDQLRKTS